MSRLVSGLTGIAANVMVARLLHHLLPAVAVGLVAAAFTLSAQHAGAEAERRREPAAGR